MPLRLPNCRRNCAALLAACVWLAVLMTPALLAAQEPGQPKVPSLPDENVIVERQPTAAPTPAPAPQPALEETPSILDGTIFSSPPADGYSASSSTTGTGIDVPNLQIPA